MWKEGNKGDLQYVSRPRPLCVCNNVEYVLNECGCSDESQGTREDHFGERRCDAGGQCTVERGGIQSRVLSAINCTKDEKHKTNGIISKTKDVALKTTSLSH